MKSYSKGKKIYPGRYLYRGYFVTNSKKYGWCVYDREPAPGTKYLSSGYCAKMYAYRYIDSLFTGEEAP